MELKSKLLNRIHKQGAIAIVYTIAILSNCKKVHNMEIQANSLGLDTEADGVEKEGIIALVKPEEVALI
jgi:hypothetical protein